MKKGRKQIALAVAVLLLTAIFASCAKNETVEIHDPEDFAAAHEGDLIALALEMVPLSASPAMFTVRAPATGTQTNSNQKATLDYSNTRDGYVMIKYNASTTKQLRVIIKGPSGVQYQYTLKGNTNYEVYPLSDGNGSYQIGVYEQIEGTRFSTSLSATISVTLADEFAPFLRPNQYVNFNANSQVVAKAAQLCSGVSDFNGKVTAIYNFVIGNITYDRQQAATVQSGYLPDVDAVMARGRGICFDFAAVMTAMLRSLDIPTKLVIGYAGDVYHAWINVYSPTDGWINSAIYFDGQTWQRMDPTFAATGNQGAQVMQYIGDGSHYTARFLY